MRRASPITKKSPTERFLRFAGRGAARECWVWAGHIRSNGYGRFMLSPGRPVYAHRFAYELWRGSIPEGLDIDHLCRNRACVNPAHLEPVSRLINLHRSPFTITTLNAAKRRCPSGHAYDALTREGHRKCNRCRRERRRRQRERGIAA